MDDKLVQIEAQLIIERIHDPGCVFVAEDDAQWLIDEVKRLRKILKQTGEWPDTFGREN